MLRSLAADVRDVSFPIDRQTMAAVFDPIVVAEIQARFAKDWKTRPDAFSPAFAGVLRAERPTASAIDAARRALANYRRDVSTVFQTVDVLVTPTVPVTAPPIEGPIEGELILRNTWPFNAAGTPALTVPCGFDRQGLPIGVQLVSAAGGEATGARSSAGRSRPSPIGTGDGPSATDCSRVIVSVRRPCWRIGARRLILSASAI